MNVTGMGVLALIVVSLPAVVWLGIWLLSDLGPALKRRRELRELERQAPTEEQLDCITALVRVSGTAQASVGSRLEAGMVIRDLLQQRKLDGVMVRDHHAGYIHPRFEFQHFGCPDDGRFGLAALYPYLDVEGEFQEHSKHLVLTCGKGIKVKTDQPNCRACGKPIQFVQD